MNKVVHLTQSTLADIPRVLRSIADEVESGNFTDSVNMVCVLEAGDKQVELFGAGGTDYYRCMALLARAQHKLIEMN